jgi:hypothetical protein
MNKPVVSLKRSMYPKRPQQNSHLQIVDADIDAIRPPTLSLPFEKRGIVLVQNNSPSIPNDQPSQPTQHSAIPTRGLPILLATHKISYLHLHDTINDAILYSRKDMNLLECMDHIGFCLL